MGCSPGGRKESDMTERLHFTILTCSFKCLQIKRGGIKSINSFGANWHLYNTELSNLGKLLINHSFGCLQKFFGKCYYFCRFISSALSCDYLIF